jgi:hypothetical protein
MKKDIMVDIETLSKYPDGVILSIAVVPFLMTDSDTFDELLSRGLLMKLNIADQRQYGRTIYPDTLAWWKRQSDDAKSILVPSEQDLTMTACETILSEFITSNYDKKRNTFWCRGLNFDLPYIQDFYRRLKLPEPINTWDCIDTKTFIKIMTGDPRSQYNLRSGTPSGFVAHNCLHDAVLECLRIQELSK